MRSKPKYYPVTPPHVYSGFYSDRYKIIAHIAAFPTAGYYLVCLRSGESIGKRYLSVEEATKETADPRLCTCKACVTHYLEHDFGLIE